MKYRPGDKAARTCQAKNDIEIPGIAIDSKTGSPKRGEMSDKENPRIYFVGATSAFKPQGGARIAWFVSAGASDDTFPDAMWPVCSAV